MKYNHGFAISTIALALITTGCVKKSDTVTPSTAYDTTQQQQPIYNSSEVVYETATPIVYDETINSSTSGVVYSEAPIDNTTITTGNGAYGQPVSSGSYNNNQTYSNPYGSTYSAPSTYTNSSSTTSSQGGIQLQIAALKNYYAAEEFKNSLSLDPKYSAYIKRGAMNKVIITGISSIAEVNRLKETRFPGSFVVRGSSSTSSTSYSTPSSSSSYGNSSYTTNSPYGNPASYGTSSSSSSSNGIGIQIGAFSSRSKAQSVANANDGQYHASVKKGMSQGRTIYRVILTGFSSRSAAKRALSSGQIPNGFVTSSY